LAGRKAELQTLTWADVNREAKVILLRLEHNKGKSRDCCLISISMDWDEIIECRWQARAVPKPDGTTGLAEFVFHKDGEPIGDFRKAWAVALKAAKTSGNLFQDLRRRPVRQPGPCRRDPSSSDEDHRPQNRFRLPAIPDRERE
jgi:hypothetical protein